MNITACICFYNASHELERCLESLDLGKPNGIDYAVCVDGKYPNFPGRSRLSDDGSRQVVNSFRNTALFDVPDYEIHKRNFYLDICKNSDYILIIDSDEYVDPSSKNWWLFRNNIREKHQLDPSAKGHDIWSIDVESNSPDYVETVEQILGRPYQQKKRPWDIQQFQPKPRLWFNPSQFEYHLNHYSWRHKDPNYPEHARDSVYGVAAWGEIQGIKLLHDHKLRSPEYLAKRLKYHRWLIQFEQTKTKHYWKHHDYKPLPHNLKEVEEWVDADVLKRQT